MKTGPGRFVVGMALVFALAVPRPASAQSKSARTVPLSGLSRIPESPYPLDVFGLAAAFSDRWDFSSFLVSDSDARRFRRRVLRLQIERFSRAFERLSSQVESRQRNIRNATVAAFLFSRDLAGYSPLAGESLSAPQLLAVRNTMRQDAAALLISLDQYDTLRRAMARASEELESRSGSGWMGEGPAPWAVTISNTDAAALSTRHALSVRLMPADVARAVESAERMSGEDDYRETLASFAPPPPDSVLSRDRPTTAPFDVDALDRPDEARGEHVDQPEHRFTRTFETGINAPVVAPADGSIAYAGEFRGYGRMVIIEHAKGLFSVFAYLGNIEVTERQTVKEGDIIGRAGVVPGLSRPGVCYQVRKGVDPVDPKILLGIRQPAAALTR